MRLFQLTIVILTVLSTSCAGMGSDKKIVLNSGTSVVQGWLETKGELTIFPSKRVLDYDPYTNIESKKCLNLINKANISSVYLEKYAGNYVRITGRAVTYSSLSDGGMVSDRLLSKKYYENFLVENSCLRDFVFVIDSIALAN